jgi:hypothetical protein
MRGRKNHGVRQALYAKRHRRYVRRTHRFNKSGGKRYSRPGPYPRYSRKTHWIMPPWPVKSKPLRMYVKRATPWPLLPGHPSPVFRRGATGRAHPPRWYVIPSLRHVGLHGRQNLQFALVGKVRRKVYVHKHKVPRLNGERRQAAWARMFYWKNGQAGYPSWDPLHRTPVFP